MKKLFVIFVLALTLLTFTPALAHDGEDHTHSVDNEVIEESLKKEGLDQAPGVVEVPKQEMLGEAPSSGFVDEAGNPISDEDYNQMREDDKARTSRNRLILGGVVGVLAVGGVTTGLILSKKKR